MHVTTKDACTEVREGTYSCTAFFCDCGTRKAKLFSRCTGAITASLGSRFDVGLLAYEGRLAWTTVCGWLIVLLFGFTTLMRRQSGMVFDAGKSLYAGTARVLSPSCADALSESAA